MPVVPLAAPGIAVATFWYTLAAAYPDIAVGLDHLPPAPFRDLTKLSGLVLYSLAIG